MTDLIQRTFEGAQIRIIQIEDEPWFVLNDVCQVLGIANPWQVAEKTSWYVDDTTGEKRAGDPQH